MTKSTRPLAIPSHIEGTRTDDILSESMLTPGSSSTGWANEDVTSTSLSGRGMGLKRLETEIPNEDDRPGISPSREDEADDEQDEEDNELDRSGNERYRDNPGREVEDDLEIASYSLNSYTPEEERQVVRKFDRRLTMFLAFLYLLSFLDRSSESSFDPGVSVHGLIGVCGRYWKRANRRTYGRPEPFFRPVRMGSHCLLYHLHMLRMDDSNVQDPSSAHIYSHLRLLMGSPGFNAVPGYVVLAACFPESSNRCLGSCLFTRCSVLPVFFL